MMSQFEEVRYIYLSWSFANAVTEKYLQALQALSSAKQLDPSNPSLHYRIIDIQMVGTYPALTRDADPHYVYSIWY